MAESFNELVTNTSLVAALQKENITVPTEVQSKAIPLALKNRDLIVQSRTGTGKTLAYLLPLFEKINVSNREMQAIILAPTHELAVQIERQIERLSENSGISVKSMAIIGDVNVKRQIEKLKEKPHIIVGSVGRILELIKIRKITAHTIKTIIMDEADRLLDKNNLENVRGVIKSTLKERQLMMFSATIPDETVSIGKEIMKDPEVVRLDENPSIPSTIEHLYFLAEQRDKIEVLRKLVRILNPEKAVVFVNKSDQMEIMTEKLIYHGLKAESIHGSDFKRDRKKVMEDFRSGKLQLLIASDIASRGLDIGGTTHIFNMTMPEDPGDYLHRAGRTGRNGNPGVVISIVTNRELPLIRMYERTLNINMAAKDMYMGKIINARKVTGRMPPKKQK